MMVEGMAASATEPPYNLATAPKALLDTLYMATRRGRRFAGLPEVDLDEVDAQELRRLIRRQVACQANPSRCGSSLGGALAGHAVRAVVLLNLLQSPEVVARPASYSALSCPSTSSAGISTCQMGRISPLSTLYWPVRISAIP